MSAALEKGSEALDAVKRELWAANGEIKRMAAELEGAAQRSREGGGASALEMVTSEVFAANGEKARIGAELEEAREAVRALEAVQPLPHLIPLVVICVAQIRSHFRRRNLFV